MNWLRMSPVLPLLLAPFPLAAKALSADQQGELRCVAALAIVANDQQRGAPGWEGLPDLTDSGARFADIVRRRIATTGGVSDTKITSAVRKQISALQAEAIKSDNPQELTQTIVEPCLAMMAKLDKEKWHRIISDRKITSD